MKKRWAISSDGGATWPRIVVPVNGSKLKIRQTRDLDKGRVFFRKSLSTSITIGNKTGDFDYLFNLERRGSRRCDELLIRLEFQCNQGWSEYFRGSFSPGSCKWDLGKCLVDIKPETVDRYSCLLSKEKVVRNILNVAASDVDVVEIPPSAEIWATTQTVGPGALPLSTWGWLGVETQSMTFPNLGTCDGTLVGGTVDVHIYWRQRIDVPCVGGNSTPPPGSGWILLTSDVSETGDGGIGSAPDCAGDGVERYVRQPLTTWPFPTDPIVMGPVVAYSPQGASVSDIVFEEPSSPECPMWFRIGNRRGFCEAIGLYVCLDGLTSTELGTGRTLHDVAEYLVDQTECDILGVRSDFFEWDPVGDAPGYSAGINYITGETNQVDHLQILQKSDVINPTASNPATIANMTFAELMEALFVMFRVFWDIDDEGYVRIEHWHYWTFQQGIDLTGYADNLKIEPRVYEHLNEQIPRVERAKFMEALGHDFVGKDILYTGPCATSEEVKEWSPGKVTTDVSYILDEPTDIAKDGFVIIACLFDGVDYSAILDVGALSGGIATNAPLSWANLQRDFWTWDRYLPDGNMNGAGIVFDGFLPSIQQDPVRVTLCCELFTFDPKKSVGTSLGQTLAATAQVEEVEHDLYVNRTTLTLKYAY